MSLIERALEENGEMRRRDLGNELGVQALGPAFARALERGVERGRLEHTGFGRYGPRSRSRS